MDFVRGYHGVGRKRVLPTPHAWERVAGFGQQANSPRCSLRSGPPARSGGGLEDENGRISPSSPRCDTLCEYIYLSARGVLSCRRFVSIFPLCAGWSLKWASLQDRLGCSGAPLPAFLSQDCSTLVSFSRSTDV